MRHIILLLLLTMTLATPVLAFRIIGNVYQAPDNVMQIDAVEFVKRYEQWKTDYAAFRERFLQLSNNQELLNIISELNMKLSKKTQSLGRPLNDKELAPFQAEWEDVLMKYPGMSDVCDSSDFKKTHGGAIQGLQNKETLKQRIIITLQEYETLNPERRIQFQSGTPILINRKEGWDLSSFCGNSGLSSAPGGGMTIDVLEFPSFNVTKMPIQSFDDAPPFFRKQSPWHWKYHFGTCSALSAMGVEFQTFSLSYDEEKLKEWDSQFEQVKNSDADYMRPCTQSFQSNEDLTRMSILIKQRPDDRYLKHVSNVLDKNKKYCERIAQAMCSNQQSIKSTMILSYGTVGCEIRDVTINDINDDLKSFPSEATRLKHGQLIDQLEACDAAYQAGYRWEYKRPELDDDCKKKVKN